MSDALRQVLFVWWSWVAPLAVQGTLLILLVILIDRMLPERIWPELRSALYLLAMLKLLLPPGLASPIGVARIMPERWRLSPDSIPIADTASTAVVSAIGVAAAIWLAGFLFLLAFGALRYRRQRRHWLREAGLWPDAALARRVKDASLEVGLRHVPDVRLGTTVRSPFVLGLARPVVLLPVTFLDEIPAEYVDHALLHEFAHIKRRDAWVSAACALIQMLYWFHPLVWIAQRRLAVLREQCCDRFVARIRRDGVQAYRRTLLFFAGRLIDEADPGGLALIGPHRLLLARLRLLEHAGQERSWARRTVTTTLVLILLIAFVPMAPAADSAIERMAQTIDRPPGCLQLRYLVLERLAREQAATSENSTPVDDRN